MRICLTIVDFPDSPAPKHNKIALATIRYIATLHAIFAYNFAHTKRSVLQ